MKPRSHDLAARAYVLVKSRDALKADIKDEYAVLAGKLPVLVMQNGLAQATGFLLAKSEGSEGAHRALLDDLATLLGQPSGQAMHQSVIAADITHTMLLTRRSLEASGWIKRYVQGVLKIETADAKETQ